MASCPTKTNVLRRNLPAQGLYLIELGRAVLCRFAPFRRARPGGHAALLQARPAAWTTVLATRAAQHGAPCHMPIAARQV